MSTRLDTPNINQDLKIVNAIQYIENIDTSFLKEIKKRTSRVIDLIDQLIALEVSKYVLYHISGDRPFDQSVADNIGYLHREKMNEFKALTGKDYLCQNNDW